MLKKIGYVFAFVMFAATNVWAGQLSVSVEPQQIQFGDTVRLELSYEGDDAGSLQPNFNVLRNDFTIYSTSTSMQSNFVNGVGHQRRMWTLTLMPKREGDLTIPPITAGAYQTTATEIEVLPSGSAVMQPQNNTAAAANKQNPPPTAANAQSSDFWAELKIDAKEPYVGQEVNGVLYIYDRKGLQVQREPYFDDTDAWDIQRVGDAEFTEKNGQRIIKLKYAFFPQKSGQLTLPRAHIDGVYMVYEETPVSSSIGGLFKLFDVDLDMSGLLGVQKPVSLQTKPLSMNVKPIPADYGNAWWLPATALRLSAKWTDERPVFKVGEAVTREISLIASGVSGSQLPELNLKSNAAWKQYPDKPKLNTATHNNEFISEAVTRVVYIPQKGGEQIVPEIKLQWYNVKTHKVETAVIPAEKMYVAGSVAEPSAAPESPAANVGAAPTAGAPVVEQAPVQPEKQIPPSRKDQWLLGLVVLGAFIAGILFSYLLLRGKRASQKEASQSENLRLVSQSLKNNDYRALRDSLLAWGQKTYNGTFINNLNELADKVNVPEFSEQMRLLNGILYAGHNDSLDKEVILQSLKNKQSAEVTKKKAPLPDLYK